MTTFQIHDLETAPEASRPLLQGALEKFGQIPNLLGLLADSPAALGGYLDLAGRVENDTAFSATERQLILLTTSTINRCEYCVAAHSAIAASQKVSKKVVDAIRDGTVLDDPKLEALRTFTRSVVKNQGFVDGEVIQAFLDAGYERRHVLEVVVGIAMKTISNYTNHLTGTELDRAFQPFEWSAPAAACSTA